MGHGAITPAVRAISDAPRPKKRRERKQSPRNSAAGKAGGELATLVGALAAHMQPY